MRYVRVTYIIVFILFLINCDTFTIHRLGQHFESKEGKSLPFSLYWHSNLNYFFLCSVDFDSRNFYVTQKSIQCFDLCRCRPMSEVRCINNELKTIWLIIFKLALVVLVVEFLHQMIQMTLLYYILLSNQVHISDELSTWIDQSQNEMLRSTLWDVPCCKVSSLFRYNGGDNEMWPDVKLK